MSENLRSLDLPQQTRRTKEMEEYEKRTPATDGRVKAHKGEVSGRQERTDLLLRELHSHLRIERPFEAQTSELRAAVARVAAALKDYTDYFYPPDPS
jgi:chromosome segregation ATPase